MKIIRTVADLKSEVAHIKGKGQSIGLVPTMGALHEGHLSLIRKAKKDNDIVITSIFVNPTQFNNPEDLVKYPRTEKADTDKLENEGVDIAFIPSVEEVYPEEDTRIFELGQVAEVMEGKMRPGHFNGVAQIVSKLFVWAEPDRAYFGEKDFQQIAVIRRLVELGNYPLEIVDCPISREADGLARSSRNMRLTEEQRKVAPVIFKTLSESKEWKKEGVKPQTVIEKVTETLDSYPHLKTEYFTIVDSKTLLPVEDWNTTSDSYPIGCIAIFCGDVRLIDNIKYIEN